MYPGKNRSCKMKRNKEQHIRDNSNKTAAIKQRKYTGFGRT
jgi:hypothetical protein